jgi:homoserine O-acetyltransferase
VTEPRMFRLGDVPLLSGETLRDAELVYTVHGTLNAAGDNAVVIPTFYTGTHARNAAYFGPGRAIDPARHFIVVPNLFGNGVSSSPSNAHSPQDGPRFPGLHFFDNVACQHRLLTQELGVKRIRLATGWSMGGCQAFQWGAQYPDMVDAVLPFCSSARTAPHNWVFLEGVKAALTADAAFKGGDYGDAPPETGLKAFARVYCGWAYSQTWFRDRLHRASGFETAEDVLCDWEADHLAWDANDLLAMLATWQTGDVGVCARNGARRPGAQGDTVAALGRITARAIVLPASTDLYFPPADSAWAVTHMPNAELRVFETDWGHCCASGDNEPAFHRFFDAAAADLLNA